jgi:hypothetical protein
MPARLYLRRQPRAFYLLTETHALVFRQPGNEETKASRSVVVAEFLPLDQVDTADLVTVPNARTVEGVLGVTSVPSGELDSSQVLTLRSILCSRDLLDSAHGLFSNGTNSPWVNVAPGTSGVS